MPGEPQLREVAWLITGPEHDPVRHVFVRLSEQVDTGIWTLELRECRGTRRATGRYGSEADARSVLDDVYAVGRRFPPLATWEPGRLEQGRWRMRTYERTEHDLRQRPTRPPPPGA